MYKPRRTSCYRKITSAVAPVFALFAVALPIRTPSASAQQQSGTDISGLQAAVALEAAMVQAISRAEKSVVAIARVRNTEGFDAADQSRAFAPFNSPNVARTLPDDPDFIPNEYAAGIIIDRDGLILTAAHVLAEDSDYWITTPDRKHYRARVKGSDPRSDLAVLQIEARGLTPIPLGDGTKVRKGQIVISLGNPYAIARDGQASASWGIVSNISRKAPPSPMDETDSGKNQLQHFGTLIQTDAKLSLGTSGGALLNLSGEMIGLTTAIAALTGYDEAAGFAMPVDDAFRRAVDLLKQGREVDYGLLGIIPSNEDTGVEGVRVQQVKTGYPAHSARLQAGDIITRVNGRPVIEADDLMLQVGRLAADDQVRLAVIRDGRPMPDVVVELTKLPVVGNKIVTAAPEVWRGLQIDYATASREFVTRPAATELGVMVIAVQPDSPAAQAGLEPGMLILAAQSAPVRSPRQFREAVEALDGPVEVRIAAAGGEPAVKVIPAIAN